MAPEKGTDNLKLPWNAEKILSARSSSAVRKLSLTRALDLMMLGYMDQGQRIIDFLYDYNNLEFSNNWELVHGICFA